MSKHAIILAGGKGSRLRPYTVVLPKPLMPIGDFAILELIILQLKKYRFSKVTLAVGHKANLIKTFFGNGERFGIKIEYVHEKKNLGTMGPLNLVKKLEKDFIVMNGDILTDLNFSKFLNHHKKNKNNFTIASFKRKVKIDFGVLFTNKGLIQKFVEKPVNNFEVSMGIYVLNKSIIKLIPKNRAFGFDDLMKKMIKKNYNTSIFLHKGSWLDIGRQDDYFEAIDKFKLDKKKYI